MTDGGGWRGSIFKTDQDRLRIGWRLLCFLVLAAAVAFVAALLLPASPLSGTIALLLGALIGGWALLASDGRPPAALGFYLAPRALSESLAGTGTGVVVAALVVAMLAASGGAVWVPQGGSTGGWLGAAGTALAFLALPAAAEEALLRGYPLQALSEAWGRGRALVVTSVAFGLIHLSNPGVTLLAVANVAAAGLWLGVIYLRTGSLWWATGAHLGWNWVHGYAADMPVSGLDLFDAPFYDGVARGPDWLGGGAFGAEGSVLATVGLLGAAAACWWSGWLRPSSAALEARPLAFAPVAA